MRTLRVAGLLLAFTAMVGLTLGTVGFSEVTSERGFDVNVGDDESAYVGYELLEEEVRDGERTPIVRYSNQFGSDIDTFEVSVSIVDGANASVSATSPDRIGSGEHATVDLTITCDETEDVTLEFEANGSGSAPGVSMTREETITCVPSE